MAFDLTGLVASGDALIIVPPFAGLDRPSLAAHLLQACAKNAGFRVRVLYANLLLGGDMGEAAYEAICYAPCSALMGERFFAGAAYGATTAETATCVREQDIRRKGQDSGPALDLEAWRRWSVKAPDWAEVVARAVIACGFPIVGCTTTFEQTSASLALLRWVKQLAPATTTILGGANCEGAMAEGLASLRSEVDYVFSGESERSFSEFLQQNFQGIAPKDRIIVGSPCLDLDNLPTPDYSEYYQQLAHFLPESSLAEAGNIWLPYETSRGCWWGEKHHCTFCGLNAQTMKHRQKSPDRVFADLKTLLKVHPTRKVCMVDNIMPHGYFASLIPRLPEELPNVHIFYEQKANLSLDQVVALRTAGIPVIQPGIEALATPLLKRMDKGVTTRQNIALLRYARAADLALNWNLLYAFPGDRAEDYQSTLELLPLLRHLNPPGGLFHLSIDRFSPYFDQPSRFGISNIRPMEAYADVLPAGADPARIAYHFVADYASASREDHKLIAQIENEVEAWQMRWRSPDTALPTLAITAVADDTYLLLDTRDIAGTETVRFLTREEASLALVGQPAKDGTTSAWAEWAKVIVERDGWYVPLATAEIDLLREFEQAQRRPANTVLPAFEMVPA